MSPPTQAWGPWPDGDAGGPRPASDRPDHDPEQVERGQAHTVGEILEGAIKTVLSGPRVLVGGAFLVVGGVQAIVLVAVWLLAGDIDLADAGTNAADVTLAEVARLSAAAAVALLGSWTVSVAMTGLGAAAADEWTAGRPITFATVAPRLRRRLGRLVLALILAVGLPLGVGIAIAATAALLAITVGGITGLLVGVVGVSVGIGGGLWLAIRLVLSPVAAVLGSGGTAIAVRESWSLTRRHFWRVLGFIALNVLLTQTVTAVVAAPLGVIVSENPEAFSGAAVIGGAVTSAVAVTLTAPFTACVTALLFLDLRERNGSVQHPPPVG
jgi:hypothetical protein